MISFYAACNLKVFCCFFSINVVGKNDNICLHMCKVTVKYKYLNIALQYNACLDVFRYLTCLFTTENRPTELL